MLTKVRSSIKDSITAVVLTILIMGSLIIENSITNGAQRLEDRIERVELSMRNIDVCKDSVLSAMPKSVAPLPRR